MCLKVNENYLPPKEPARRYKLVRVLGKNMFGPSLRGEATQYVLNESMTKAHNDYYYVDYKGYHVYVSLKEAIKDAALWREPNHLLHKCHSAILLVECTNFVAGGDTYGFPSVPSEIWRTVKPLRVLRRYKPSSA